MIDLQLKCVGVFRPSDGGSRETPDTGLQHEASVIGVWVSISDAESFSGHIASSRSRISDFLTGIRKSGSISWNRRPNRGI
jgi:hypothetical protein